MTGHEPHARHGTAIGAELGNHWGSTSYQVNVRQAYGLLMEVKSKAANTQVLRTQHDEAPPPSRSSALCRPTPPVLADVLTLTLSKRELLSLTRYTLTGDLTRNTAWSV